MEEYIEKINKAARELFNALRVFGDETGVDTDDTITMINDTIEYLLDKKGAE